MLRSKRLTYWFFALLLGLNAFFWTSIASAATYTIGPYISGGGNTASQNAKAACEVKRDEILNTVRVEDPLTYWYATGCTSSSNTWYTTQRASAGSSPVNYFYFSYQASGGCPAGTEADSTFYCVPPPPPPESCTDLQSQEDPAGTIYEADKVTLVACNQGCAIEIDTYLWSESGQNWLLNGSFTGVECPGGFDENAGFFGDWKDIDPDEQEWQNCYNSSGTYIGQVGANMTCPSFVNCWNEDRTHVDAVAPDPGSCPTGTTSDATRDQANWTTESAQTSTTNPDGSSETETQTTTTQTGLDGSKSSSTTLVNTTCDAAQNCTTTETAIEAGEDCEGLNCGADEMTVDNYDDCTGNLVCTGDVHNCALLELERAKVCQALSLDEDSVAAALAQAAGEGKLASVDQDGLLTDGLETSVNIPSVFNLSGVLADNGAAGSCPAPHDFTFMGATIQFKYDTICGALEDIRPLVLFAASFLCMMMIGRSVLGTGKD